MKKYRIDVEQLPLLISKMNYTSSWNDTNSENYLYQNEPIRISVYNEVLKFSKEELESVKNLNNFNKKPYAIWNALLTSPDALVFSAFVEKKAFFDNMTELSQILTSYIDENTSFGYYAFVLDMNKSFSTTTHVLDFLKDMDTPEKIRLTPLLFKEFFECIPGNDNFEERFELVIKFCMSNIETPLASFLIEQLNLAHVDINQNFPLQSYLGKKEAWRGEQYQKLFISTAVMPQLAQLLDKGFRFEEHHYTYYCDNESLFTALIRSEREDVIRTILPYITHIVPHDNNQEKQTQLIESFKHKPYYDFISSHYFKHLLTLQLEPKESTPKLKI